MSLELTARLTLSSCVSQLTDFFKTDIAPELLNYGFETTILNLCDLAGECYPYRVVLIPAKDVVDNIEVMSLTALVERIHVQPVLNHYEKLFRVEIERNGMTISNTYLCALHVCGDFIKFNEKGS